MQPQTLKSALDLLTLTGLWVVSILVYLLVTVVVPLIITFGRYRSWNSVWLLVQYHAKPYYLYAKYRFKKPGGTDLRHWTSILDRKHSFIVRQTEISPNMLAVTQFKEGILHKECHYLTLLEWEEERKKFGLYPIIESNAKK